jgi:hypothetical protein
VRAGVVQVLALQQDLCAADAFGQAPRVIDRRGAADVVLQVVDEFLLERGIVTQACVCRGQFLKRGNQRFRDKGAAVRTEATLGVGIGMIVVDHGLATADPPRVAARHPP